jgi:D-alanyl-D-alanine endopeptidase (penicillin-binding protein 7)
LIQTNADIVRPIASITKLMTAMVTLDYSTDLSRPLKSVGKVWGVLPRGTWTRGELLHAMLVRSDNNAAETLAADYPGGRAAFIEAMNAKARMLDMPLANFNDASGLDKGNVTTILGVKKLLMASADYASIREISIKKEASFEQRIKNKIKRIDLPNTNKQMLFEFEHIVVTKTGLTTPAGWCLGMVVEKDAQKYIVVVLGAKSKLERYNVAKEIMSGL